MTKTATDTNKAEAFLKDRKKLARRNIGASILFSCLNASFMIVAAWILSTIVADAVFKGMKFADLSGRVWILAGLYTLRALCQYAAERSSFSGAQAVKRDLRARLISSILSMGPMRMGREQSGSLINSYVEGVEALHNYYAQILPSRIVAAFITLAIFFCITPLDYVSSLILIVTAPLIPIFMIWIGKGAEALSQKQWQRLSYMSGFFLDRIQGLTTIKLFDAGLREARLVDDICNRFRLDTMAVLRIAFLSSLALEFFATVSIAMIAVMIGFRLMWGEMQFQPAFFILLLAPEFYLPLRRMGALHHARMDAVAAAEKIVEMIPEHSERKNGRTIGRIETITFDHVTFFYEDGRAILKDVSFHIGAEEKIALTGPSGAGKSTIFLLLLGYIQPQGGRILVNGVPLNELDMDVWRGNLAWIAQRPYLFSGTVQSNILLGADDQVSRERCRRLADLCGISDLLNVETGRSGLTLSGGQAQRAAIVRALMRDADFLMMDEASAHLDEATERVVMDALRQEVPGKMMFFVTHRPLFLSMADRILCLENGVLREKDREAA